MPRPRLIFAYERTLVGIPDYSRTTIHTEYWNARVKLCVVMEEWIPRPDRVDVSKPPQPA